MKTLREIFIEIVAEGNSPAVCENQAMALRRYVEQVLGVTDQEALHSMFEQTYELLNDGTAFDEDLGTTGEAVPMDDDVAAEEHTDGS